MSMQTKVVFVGQRHLKSLAELLFDKALVEKQVIEIRHLNVSIYIFGVHFLGEILCL